MRFAPMILCLLFSGTLAFAHCGSCGTENKKTQRMNCVKSKKKKNKCDSDADCESKCKNHKQTDGHKAHHHSH